MSLKCVSGSRRWGSKMCFLFQQTVFQIKDSNTSQYLNQSINQSISHSPYNMFSY